MYIYIQSLCNYPKHSFLDNSYEKNDVAHVKPNMTPCKVIWFHTYYRDQNVKSDTIIRPIVIIWRSSFLYMNPVSCSHPNVENLFQVLEIRDDKARVIRSKRDKFSELQVVNYI